MDHEEPGVEIDPEELKKLYEPQPIPELLHSVYSEGPFRQCTVCDRDLSDGTVYEIQKVFRGTEVVFEYALCFGCYEDISQEFSRESIERVQNFVESEFKPVEDVTHCHFCGLPRSVIHNFTLVGMCCKHALIVPGLVMCETCEERLQTVLSQKTRDVQGDFIRDNFPGIPANFDLSPSFGLLS